jgi:hypothetical protein
MEGGSLFNPGFLGSHFYWWIGQIADDSTWRDNIIPGKFESKDQVPGWGRRYKVRIIGLHDREETTIPSDQLPWAQVMYPITAGGGQAAASATPNIRQGNFVFGFFLDGQDQQVPVIMGVLGNNAQTVLGTKIGDDKSNFSATSGFATPVNGDKDLNIKVPKESLVTVKPKSAEQSAECSPPPSGVSVNKFGLRSDLPLSKAQFQDQQRAILEADSRISSGLLRQEDRASFIQSEVAKGIKNRCQESNSPGSPSQPGATREQPDNPHELSAADVIRNEKMLRKVPLSSPCKKQKTDLKNIQIVIENLTKDINKVQQAANSYIDAVSTNLNISKLESILEAAASKISTYMKSIFDQVRGYVLKQFNAQISKVVDKSFPNERNKILNLKEKGTSKLICLFNKISSKLPGLISSFLSKLFKDGKGNFNPVAPIEGTTPVIPICSVEEITGNVLGNVIGEMTQGIDSAINPIGNFVSESFGSYSQLGGNVGDVTNVFPIDSLQKNTSSYIGDILDPVGGSIGNSLANTTSILNQSSSIIGGITGNITSALGFINSIITFFSCDEEESCPINDYHTFQSGGGASKTIEEPVLSNIAKNTKQNDTLPKKDKPFAQPGKEKLFQVSIS